MRILCSADLHLGRVSALLTGEVNEKHSSAACWLRLVDLALSERADAVVLAGDVFDASPFSSRRTLLEGLVRLKEAGIPVLAVAGNHDYDSLRTFYRQNRDVGLQVLGLSGGWESAIMETRSGPFEAVGWSFLQQYQKASALGGFPGGSLSLPVLGVVHGEVAPATSHHPLSTAEMIGRGAHAWVLGHVHKHRSYADCSAVYTGSPQALDMGETGVHGALWLNLEPGSARFSELVPLSSAQFEYLEVTLGDEEDQVGAIEAAIASETARVKSANPWLETAQWRVKVKSPKPQDRLVKTEPVELDDLATYEITDWIRFVPRDLDKDALRNDPVGLRVRMLMALNGRDLPKGSPPVDVEPLVKSCSERLASAHAQAFNVLATLESVKPRLSEEEATEKARAMLAARIERELGQIWESESL